MSKLLIVDDEEEIREFLSEFFTERRYSVLTASTKDEALLLLEREQPAVALLDVRMKGQRDGVEILQWIKDKGLNVKTIMVTGVETSEAVEEAKSLGADDYITKPLSLEYLEQSVTQRVAALAGGAPKEQDPGRAPS
ncbi:MAG: hypothetical protein A3G87_01935 [Omnitrophica bacterium RIFCSPLOWO2_12_FULL_50_11]|nr:MAG: hypothetical protein A3G87_01935 [Omnitrophica bacterium RIFCSPLOWO2_12_FULL_50_11]